MSGGPGSIGRLAAALDGEVAPGTDWMELLATATRAWMGPALYLALERGAMLQRVPDEERDFLALLHARNRERNRRLLAQMVEAGAAMNRVGIRPIVLKGAAILVTAPAEVFGARMISDLDLAIGPSELSKAAAALSRLGYEEGPSEREWLRPADVGMLEFHLSPSARSAAYLSGELRVECRPIAVEGAELLLPSATARALHLIVHDMIKQGDLWRFRLDFRHVADLVALERSDEGVDWSAIRQVMADPVAARALDVQRAAMAGLFGTVTDGPQPAWRARAIQRARIIAAERGAGQWAARALGNLRWGLHRLGHGYRWRGAGNLAKRSWAVMAGGPAGSRL